MNKLKLIIKREFIAKVRNKTFLVMTIMSPLIVVGLGLLIGYLSKDSDDNIDVIAYIDEAAILSKEDILDTKAIRYEDFSSVGVEVAKSLVENGDYYGLLVIPKKNSIVDIADNIEFYSEKSPSMSLVSSVEMMVENRLNHIQFEQLGIDIDELNASKINSDIKILNFTGEKSSKLIRGVKIAIGLSAGYMIMMFIIIYGAMVMRSVIEEKTSRIIEVIISSVKPFQLMMGKIIGTALAGLLQFSIWGIILLIIVLVSSSILGVSPTEVTSVNMPIQDIEAMSPVLKSCLLYTSPSPRD